MFENKTCGGRALRIAFGITLVLLLSGSAGALSNSGGGSWAYYKDIAISNSGSALSDYQVLVNLTSANFPTNAQASGADIRFTDASGAELSYWIESWDYAGRSANTWVKVPSVGVGATTIRMWYGNPSATSASNGTGTFDLFDNFDGASLDASKWDVNTGANYSISGGNIKIKGQGTEWHFGKPSIYSKSSFNDYIIGVRVSQDLDNSLGDINYWLMDATHYYAIQHETRTAGADNDFVFNDGSTLGIFADYRYEWNVNEWVRYTLKIHSSVLDFERVSETDATRKVAGINIGNSKNFATTGRKIGLSGDGALSGSNFVVDWIFVRKYASSGPSVSVGVEMPVLSNSGGGSWQYYKDITISNAGSALSNYQVLVSLNSGNFPTNAQASGADIRFTDAGGAELNYWIENWDYAGRSAKVWVNVKSIPAGASSIRMWYGNPSAGNSSNGKRTFVFFDDFESYQLGEKPTGWQFTTPGEYIVSTDYRYDGEKSIKFQASNWADQMTTHDSQPISNFVYQAKGYATSSSYGEHGIVVNKCPGFWCSPYQDFYFEFTFSSSNTMRTRYKSPNHIDSSHSTTGYFNTNEWNTLEIRSFNGGIELYVNGNKAYEDQNFGVVEFDKFGLGDDAHDGRTSYWDQLIVRKYAFPEPSVSVGAEQANSGLVGYWSFDGNAQDSSGSGNHGTISGATFVQGVSGQALSFDGVDDYVNVGDKDSLNPHLNSMTIEAWVKTSDADSLGRIYAKGTHGGSQRGYSLQLYPGTGGKVSLIFGTGHEHILRSDASITDGLWKHIVGVIDRTGNMELYINNVKQSTTIDVSDHSGVDIGANTYNACIGVSCSTNGVPGLSEYLNGIIDEVRIYNRALNASEIQAHYNALAPVLTTITVTPSPATVASGSTQTFTALPRDQFGNSITATVTWSSSNLSVGTINAAGVFTAVAAGTTTVTATSGSVSGSATVTVSTLSGIITGTVTSTAGAAIQGATLIVAPGDVVFAIATTNAAGSYSMSIAPGIHNVTASASGFASSTATVTVSSGATITQNFALQPTSTYTSVIASISNASGSKGSNVSVPIIITNATNVAAGTITLSFYPSIVEVTGVSAGDLGTPVYNINNAAGTVTITASSPTGRSGTVTFANVILKAVGTNGSISPLNLNVSILSDANGNKITCIEKSGVFTVSAFIKGDVNGDGSINVIDALFVSQYTVGIRTLSSSQLAAADVNGDGQVTVVDALFIAQYTVGLRQSL